MENENGLFSMRLSLRWADLDPNFHLRHSVYYDFGAQQRIHILESLGLTTAVMKEQAFGPVIFREECVFRREIKLNDDIMIYAWLSNLSADYSRWTIQHQLLSSKNKLMATLTVDGAWMDTKIRKLVTSTPDIVKEVFEKFPRNFSPVEKET